MYGVHNSSCSFGGRGWKDTAQRERCYSTASAGAGGPSTVVTGSDVETATMTVQPTQGGSSWDGEAQSEEDRALRRLERNAWESFFQHMTREKMYHRSNGEVRQVSQEEVYSGGKVKKLTTH
uniref:Uncharacterized protein n=1 Tax=Lygus hesperus TaxID=30085 RepID=A0A146MC50_LYGHE